MPTTTNRRYYQSLALTCLKEELTLENVKLPIKHFSSSAAEEQAEVCTIPAELEATAKDTSS